MGDGKGKIKEKREERSEKRRRNYRKRLIYACLKSENRTRPEDPNAKHVRAIRCQAGHAGGAVALPTLLKCCKCSTAL